MAVYYLLAFIAAIVGTSTVSFWLCVVDTRSSTRSSPHAVNKHIAQPWLTLAPTIVKSSTASLFGTIVISFYALVESASFLSLPYSTVAALAAEDGKVPAETAMSYLGPIVVTILAVLAAVNLFALAVVVATIVAKQVIIRPGVVKVSFFLTAASSSLTTCMQTR